MKKEKGRTRKGQKAWRQQGRKDGSWRTTRGGRSEQGTGRQGAQMGGDGGVEAQEGTKVRELMRVQAAKEGKHRNGRPP